MSVPASFRAALSDESFQGVVLFQSYTQSSIEGVGMSVMKNMSNRIDSNFDFFSDGHDELATVLFGDSIQLAFDGDGRITLPQNFIDFAGIKDKVSFVGLGQKFQLWNPETFESRRLEARKAVQSKKSTLPKGSS